MIRCADPTHTWNGRRCVTCLQICQRAWYVKNTERIALKNKSNRFNLKIYNKERNRELKITVFKAYGGAFCVCCGERRLAFLTLDHIHSDGKKHREELGNRGRGQLFYHYLRRNNFPDFGLRVLCFNCNCGRQANGGTCPHEEERNIILGHSFEQSGPGDSIMNLHRPEGHAHLDQKLDKGMRSPMLAQLPQDAGLETPATSSQSGSGHGDSGYHGGGGA